MGKSQDGKSTIIFLVGFVFLVVLDNFIPSVQRKMVFERKMNFLDAKGAFENL